ncbi:hypothetical protein [Spirosoma migulaei]
MPVYTHSNSTKFTLNNYAAYLLILIPIFLFYSLFFHFLTNIPYIDDFSWYFNFINKFDSANAFQDKLHTFLDPYNNHRHYFQRLLIIPFVYLTGQINISFFIIIGNISFIAFLSTIIRKTNLIGSAVLVWLAFQPISFMNYYTFAFFNLPVFLFSLLCIRLMVQQGTLRWIILLGLLATFSNGNGLLVWLLGILISLVQKDGKRLIVYGATLSLLVLVYSLQGGQADSPRVIDVEFISHALLYFIQIHAYFVNWPDYALPWIPLLIGTGLLLIVGYLVIKNKPFYYKSEKSYLLVYLLFLSLSMALISFLRSSVNGLNANVIDHYKIYPCLFLGILIYYCTEQKSLTTFWKYSFVAISILITLVNYTIYIPRMYTHFTNQVADALNYHSTKKWLFYPVIQGKKEYEFVNTVSNAVIKKGYYSEIEPSFTETNTRYEANADSTKSGLILRAENLTYSPFSEHAFFVVNCGGYQYHFPVLSDRSWKDILRFRFQQTSINAVIDWNALNEPCLSHFDKIRFARLKNGSLTYYPLSVVAKSLTK